MEFIYIYWKFFMFSFSSQVTECVWLCSVFCAFNKNGEIYVFVVAESRLPSFNCWTVTPIGYCTIKQIRCHAIKQNRYWTEIVGSSSIIISFKCYSVLKIFKLNRTANFGIYWTEPTPTPGGVVLKFVYCVD